MSMIKYRVHEVAKDFNVTSKVISQILTDYIAPPKNHMQVLENHELAVIFEYMTQHNQAASLEDIFKVPEKPAAALRRRRPRPKRPRPHPRKKARSAEHGARAQPQQTGSAQPKKAEKPNKPHTPRQVAEKRVIDTRGSAAVNIEKYNEKFEDMAGNKTGSGNMRLGTKEKDCQQVQAAPEPAVRLVQAPSGRAQPYAEASARDSEEAAAQGRDTRRNFRRRTGLPYEEDCVRGHKAALQARRVRLRFRCYRL